MPHVDEGQLHAYLDAEPAALGVPADAFERHLAECAPCRGRLEQARRTRERASAILMESGPPRAEIPPFESIAGIPAPRRRRVSPTALAWAATVVLALGLGWSMRTLLTPDVGGRETEEVAEAAAEPEAPIALTQRAAAPAEDLPTAEATAASAETVVRQSTPARRASKPTQPTAATAESEATSPTAEPAVDAPPDQAKGFQSVAPPAPLADAAPSAAARAPARAERQRARDGVPTETGLQQSAPAAPAVVLSGTVTNDDGEPLSGTVVGIPETGLRTVTDSRGNYRLTVPADRIADSAAIEVAAALLGYESETQSLAFEPGRQAKQDFRLSTSVLALEGMVAGAGAADEAGADAETPRVLTAAIRYLSSRLPAAARTFAFDERILVCDGDRCNGHGDAGEWSEEVVRQVRRDVGVAEAVENGGPATKIALSIPEVTGSSAVVSALVNRGRADAHAVRLELRQSRLRWRVTDERRIVTR